MADEKAKIILEFDGKNFNLLDSAQNKLDKMEKGASNLGQSFFSLGNIVKIAFGASVIKGISDMLKAVGESETAVATLNQSLANTGHYSAKASADLQSFAKQLQAVTTYDDEAIMGAEGLIAQFGFQGETLKGLTKATLDFAASKRIDLQSAADIVAKSVGSETNALSRYGVTIEGAAGSTKRAEEAMRGITQIFGGQATAQANTFAGAVAQLKNKFGEFLEDAGKNLLPTARIVVGAIGIMLDIFAKFLGWIQSNWGDVFTWMGSVVKTSATLIGTVFDTLLNWLGARFQAVLAQWGPLLWASAQLIAGNVLGAIQTYNDALKVANENAVLSWNDTVTQMQAAGETWVAANKINTDAVASEFGAAWEKIKALVANANKSNTTVVNNNTKEQLRLLKDHWAEVLAGKKLNSTQIETIDKESTGFFSNMMTVMKAAGRDGFEAWKAMAIAKATIDTYTAANGAYASLAAIPVVGPVLGALAAAAAIAAGIANVYTISRTEMPAAAYGGIIPGTPQGMPLIAGEGGRSEAIIPLDKGIQNELGIGGKPEYHFHFAGPVFADRNFPQEIAQLIDGALEKLRGNRSSQFAVGMAEQYGL